MRRLRTVLLAYDRSSILAVMTLPLLLCCEFFDLVKLMVLLRHDQSVLIDVKEIIADLFCRTLMTLVLITIRITCSRLRLLSSTIAPN